MLMKHCAFQLSYCVSGLYCRGTVWQRQGPTILIALAIPLILADQLRHVLQGTHIPGFMVI